MKMVGNGDDMSIQFVVRASDLLSIRSRHATINLFAKFICRKRQREREIDEGKHTPLWGLKRYFKCAYGTSWLLQSFQNLKSFLHTDFWNANMSKHKCD